LSYSWFQTSQTGGQWYSDTSPFSIPWSVCPFIRWSVFLSISPFVRPSTHLPIRPSPHPSVCLSVCQLCLSICLFTCTSVHTSVCLSVCPSICLYVCHQLRQYLHIWFEIDYSFPMPICSIDLIMINTHQTGYNKNIKTYFILYLWAI
jgi:hypothetical protein